MKRYLIYGAGGHGKVVVNALQQAGMHCDGFVDGRILPSWCNLPVISESQLTHEDCIHIAIGHAPTRQRIASQSQHQTFFSVIHPAAIVAQSTLLSNQGVFVAAGAIIGPDASIDDHSIINHGAVVDHDCKVGKFCHVAPNAVIGGATTIGENVMVGAGAVILPGLTICDNVTIGAGAVVTKDILTPQTVIGVPAKNIDII